MQMIARLAISALLVLPLVGPTAAAASPELARVAAIATTAPLPDHSQQSIDAALEEALSAAMRGAAAMGLRFIRVRQAVVLTDMVSVQILATDTAPDAGASGDKEASEEPETPPARPLGPTDPLGSTRIDV